LPTPFPPQNFAAKTGLPFLAGKSFSLTTERLPNPSAGCRATRSTLGGHKTLSFPPAGPTRRSGCTRGTRKAGCTGAGAGCFLHPPPAIRANPLHPSRQRSSQQSSTSRQHNHCLHSRPPSLRFPVSLFYQPATGTTCLLCFMLLYLRRFPHQDLQEK
jgi:hypothetical protein